VGDLPTHFVSVRRVLQGRAKPVGEQSSPEPQAALLPFLKKTLFFSFLAPSRLPEVSLKKLQEVSRGQANDFVRIKKSKNLNALFYILYEVFIQAKN
jgi:hypothetical protein